MLEKRKNTNLKKYGVDHPMKTAGVVHNFKESCTKKYGVDSYSKTKEYIEKVKQTCLEKYGVTHYNQTIEGKQKIKESFIKKYGIDNISKLDSTIKKIKTTKKNRYDCEYYNNPEKTKRTCLTKYGVKSILKHYLTRNKIQLKRKEKFINYLFHGNRLEKMVTPLFSPEDFTDVNKIYWFQCNVCGKKFQDDLDDGLIPKCSVCFRNNNISLMEKEFLDYLKIPDTKENRQVIIGEYKVDGLMNKNIYEFLGDYWHGNPMKYDRNDINETNKKSFGSLYDDTLNKLNKLHQMGYSVYYMWEKDWMDFLKQRNKEVPVRVI